MRLQSTGEKQEDIKNLLEENIAISKAILKSAEKTKHYIFWSQIASWIKLLLILIPIILAIIYLPALLEKASTQMRSIFNPLGDSGSLNQIKDIESFLQQLKTLEKK